MSVQAPRKRGITLALRSDDPLVHDADKVATPPERRRCDATEDLAKDLARAIGGLAVALAGTDPRVSRSGVRRQLDRLARSTACLSGDGDPWARSAILRRFPALGAVGRVALADAAAGNASLEVGERRLAEALAGAEAEAGAGAALRRIGLWAAMAARSRADARPRVETLRDHVSRFLRTVVHLLHSHLDLPLRFSRVPESRSCRASSLPPGTPTGPLVEAVEMVVERVAENFQRHRFHHVDPQLLLARNREAIAQAIRAVRVSLRSSHVPLRHSPGR